MKKSNDPSLAGDMNTEKRISAVIALRFADPIERLLGELTPEDDYSSGCIGRLCVEIADRGEPREVDQECFKSIFDSFMSRFDSDDAHHMEQALADMLILVDEVVEMPRGSGSLETVVAGSNDWVFWWVEGELDEIADAVDAESDPRVAWNRCQVSRLVDRVRSSLEESGDIGSHLRDAESDGREISSWLSGDFS
ncbi:hypothetical protein ACFW3Z_25415 [Nocardiopsis alba]|uniref:hypothetical protein n=1 Tax=Nocardiopsis alba TaxID=53437 RepID=UPI0033B0F36E